MDPNGEVGETLVFDPEYWIGKPPSACVIHHWRSAIWPGGVATYRYAGEIERNGERLLLYRRAPDAP